MKESYGYFNAYRCWYVVHGKDYILINMSTFYTILLKMYIICDKMELKARI
ncbi:hypothetical protein [Clostridium aciditolerans]|uniref:Uncharacterized protein n=1 Tax=Clostridium aciditolerans TaxID=339861 RepID=A0A934HV18_9CLOT|nr:hypothetical protein [Clostridium aciditolerans]MBI6871358.1 hypothetical protein [Clostridium aciditolerans]